MTKKYVLKIATIVIAFLSLSATSQNSNEFWVSVSATKAKQSEPILRKIELKTEKYFQLNMEGLKSALQNVGNRENTGNTIISFPNSEGKLNKYKVFEAPIMESELQAQFPNMRSYAGQGMDNPTEIIRFSITPKGLHAMFLGTSNGTQFIDPFSEEGNIYTVYAKKNLEARNFDFECGVIDDPLLDRAYEEPSVFARNANDGQLRNYRLAVTCTGEYAAFHGGTVAGVLAAIVVTITRVNTVFERDLSITMTLVANNTSIIFTNAATDPYDNDNPGVLINQGQSLIDATIGSSNYDVGHTFSTGGGGLAGLGVTCNNNQKARGITGTPAPVGDPYDIDFVAHELGHQFGGPHTFNGNAAGTTCFSQRSAANAYEPGSGSTIMAYAGICSPQNVQNNSDAYFHQASLNRIWAHVTSTGACPVNRLATGNTEPIAAAGTNFNIPQSTPYKLDGSNSTDIDGLATLTYTWEQYDLGPTGLPTETTTSGPLVRSFEGTSNPVRYVPRLSDIITNGGISTTWEKLATVSRNINYRLTVRDNDARGGQTDDTQLTATVRAGAGPFTVTSQNTSGISWDIGTTQTVTWDVAGTTANSVNEANVNILLSTDGGINFDTVLASNTPNDGSHTITVPNVASSSCRIMVEAANGIFFNVNGENIIIGVTITCIPYSTGAIAVAIPDGVAANQQGAPVFVPLTITDNAIVAGNLKVNVDVTHSYIGDLIMQLQAPSGNFVNIWARTCNSSQFANLDVTFEDGNPEIICGSPTSGDYAPASSLSAFDGEDINGTWNLVFVDFFDGDAGIVNNWSLELCVDENLTVEDNTLEDLSIYPNPNNGEFKIGFNPQSGEAITIAIYDMRGRAIYTKSFNNVSRFEEAIQLNNAQSGMYMLMIFDGSQKVTKKIIVE